jgi:hypothetical protein
MDIVAIWVKLPRLVLDLWSLNVLKAIGNTIGTLYNVVILL